MGGAQALRAKFGPEGHVALSGFVSDTEVPGYLRAAYVRAMSSDYEGLPVTLVEALFCGLPGVISEYVPSLEIVADSLLVVRDIVDELSAVLGDEVLYPGWPIRHWQPPPNARWTGLWEN